MPHHRETITFIPRRSTIKGRLSRRDLETSSVLSNEIREFGPCTFCRINLELGVRIFAVVHIIYCLVVLVVHYVELMSVLGIIDADFKYMTPATKDSKMKAEVILGFKQADEKKVSQSWVPTVLNCVTDSLQLIAGILIIPATFTSSQKLCGIWLIATYLLYFPHMFYFGFAIAIGTSWISLVIQVFDSLFYTPYAIWIVRAYMDSLGSLKDAPPEPLIPDPDPLPLPSSPPHHRSHSHMEVIKEKHVRHSNQPPHQSSSNSSSVTDHDHDVHKSHKKSINRASQLTVHSHRKKGDGVDDVAKRLGL